MMNSHLNLENKIPASILKDIKHYFDFLDGRGFKISSAEYSSRYMGNWYVKFESAYYCIYVTNDRSEIILEFISAQKLQVPKNRISIEMMIYLVSNGHNYSTPYKGNHAWGKKKQLETLADLLAEYLDPITQYFRNESEHHEINQ
jgi:hypothetical protein